MNVDTLKAVKPLHQLQKQLEDFPAHPSPEQVHNLRTRARHLEAVVHMFSAASDRDAQHLLKLIKPVRKAAGRVRDMDVFIAKLSQITDDSSGEGSARLTDHITDRREKHLARLRRSIAQRRKRADRAIRRYVRSLESGDGITSPAAPQILAEQLDSWPRLHAGNLHEFRIRAKELRYMLQLVPEVDQGRMEALGEVKDLAGEWHDWLELRGLAKETLNPSADQEILQQMAAITREKLRAGLAAANRLRKLSWDLPRAA
jgi:CHAD domain-containing protein